MIEKAYAVSLDSQYGFATNQFSTLGGVISNFITPLFALMAVVVVFYFLYAAVKLITSAGDKTAVASARGMITHAIIGIVLLMIVFLIAQFLPEFLELNSYQITR